MSDVTGFKSSRSGGVVDRPLAGIADESLPPLGSVPLRKSTSSETSLGGGSSRLP